MTAVNVLSVSVRLARIEEIARSYAESGGWRAHVVAGGRIVFESGSGRRMAPNEWVPPEVLALAGAELGELSEHEQFVARRVFAETAGRDVPLLIVGRVPR